MLIQYAYASKMEEVRCSKKILEQIPQERWKHEWKYDAAEAIKQSRLNEKDSFWIDWLGNWEQRNNSYKNSNYIHYLRHMFINISISLDELTNIK